METTSWDATEHWKFIRHNDEVSDRRVALLSKNAYVNYLFEVHVS